MRKIGILVAIISVWLCGVAEAKVDDMVVETIIYEAASEPFKGQVEVAKVIRNRCIERNQTASEVVLSPYQFSCWNKPYMNRKYTDREYKTALRAWNVSRAGGSEANMYCRSDCDVWWRSSPKIEYLYTIGAHDFFKEDR